MFGSCEVTGKRIYAYFIGFKNSLSMKITTKKKKQILDKRMAIHVKKDFLTPFEITNGI